MLVGQVACRRYCALARWISNRPGPRCGEGDELQDVARRVRKLRRKVHRELPVASASRIADLDHRMSYRDIARMVQQEQFGVDPAGAALALCRACANRGLTSWCYEFGFPQILTHAVTVVETDGVLRVHDPFFNLGYPISLNELLDSLRNGVPVTARRPPRDRKIYILDPAGEPEGMVRWLEANADRELEPQGWFRRFELAWSPEAFSATFASIRSVYDALADQGYPTDLQFLMLHPLRVFDGQDDYRDPRTMPLVGGRDLRSPVAALRVAERKLASERASSAEKAATIERLEAELAGAHSRISQMAAERDAWLQQKVALQADTRALEGDLAKTRSQLSTAVNLRAQRDSQIAQLRAEIEDSARQFELQAAKMVALEADRQEQDSARLRLEVENRDLQLRLEAGSRQYENLRKTAARLEARVAAGEQQIIEMTHYFGPLLDEVDQLRRELHSEMPGSRLRALWHGLAKKCAPILRRGPVRH
jgi:hypothetical protein